jgi:CubicO group peptidase (beta-lactamase class C family)
MGFTLLIVCGCEETIESWTEMDRTTGLILLSEDQSEEIDQIVFPYIEDYSYISIGLLDQTGPVFIRSYGEDRIDKTDVYASVTKPVTSVIFFQLLETGEIASVDDPIGTYSEKYRDVMPDEYADTPVTFKHLLSHQSGIPHHDRIWKDGKLALEFKPGTSTMYSTRGYGVLGQVMEDVTGLNYNQLVQRYIADPVGAHSFSVPSFLFEAPGGLVSSTISDMALFAEGVMDFSYISDSTSMQLCWEPYTQDGIGDIGLGWYLAHAGTDSLAVFHAGSNGKPRAFIALRPLQHIGVVILGKQVDSEGQQRFYDLARDLIQFLEERED